MLDNLAWMRGDEYGSVVKSSYWLLEATRCFNQLYVHTHEKVFSLNEKTWSLWSKTKIISPGSSPGCCSPSPQDNNNVIFWLSFMPLSIWIFFSQTVFLQLQLLHLFLGQIRSGGPGTPCTQTECAEPFLVLSDEFLFAYQCLGSWDSSLLLLSTTSAFTFVTNHVLVQS